MPKSKKIEPIPENFKSLKEVSDFWDLHSAADYWDESQEATFEIDLDAEPRYFLLEREIAQKLHHIAKAEKIHAETLLNLWVQEKLMEKMKPEYTL